MRNGVAQARDVKAATERAAHSRWTLRLARLGLAAKGFLYATVATLALLVVFRAGGKVTDREGAIQTIAERPFGKALLVVLAIGLGGYAIWRFLEAVLGHKLETGEEEGIARRVAYFGRALLYAGTCVVTVLVISGSRAGRGGKEEDRATAVILDLPFGSWIVAGVGLGFLGAAAVNAYRAVTGKFRDELKTEQLSASEERWVTTVGSIGHGARVVVFAIVGVFLIRAAIEYDPKEAVGLDGALLKVAQEAYGTVLLGIVAAGLAAYGLFCFIQARYREV